MFGRNADHGGDETRVDGATPGRDATDQHPLVLIAYRVNHLSPMRLTPAPASRQWMAATRARFANRCLPLRLANEAGWFVLNTHALRVTWSGEDNVSSLHIEYLDGSPPSRPAAVSHFGHGILTWNIPYLFRTSPGYNLLVRGPANWPKDGAYPLEGIVETDWCVATFTMNWQLTRAGLPITFDADEPVCMLVPQRRGELEAFRPEIRDIDSNPELAQRHRRWHMSRTQFLFELGVPGSDAAKRGWQKHYYQGTAPDGVPAAEHQLRLGLRTPAEPDGRTT